MPVYNSVATLREVVGRVLEVLSKGGQAFEIVLVNDGSADESWSLVRELAVEREEVRGIDLVRNYGQHNALLCGIRAAQYEVIVTLDDDLQHPPEEIPKLLGKLAEGYEVVYGTPGRERHGMWRAAGSQATKIALRRVLGVEMARQVSAFRAFRTRVRDGFARYEGVFVSIDVLLTWGAGCFGSVEVRREGRRWGRSHYTFGKLVAHAVNMVTGFSVWPLRVASIAGFLFAGFGACVLAFVVGRYLIEGGSVPGFPFLASIVAILSGAELFALGVIGEYLARMYFRVMARPTYVVRSIVDGRDHEQR